MHKKEIFKAVATAAARSTAVKRKVGAVIIDEVLLRSYPVDQCIVAVGYNHNNGKPCEDAEGNTLPSVVHAEVDALESYEARWGRAPLASVHMYVSHQPCVDCEAALAKVNVSYTVVEEFLKFDGDKPRYDLIPPSALKALADVYTFGARKYKPNNWKLCEEPEKYLAALMRHLEAYRSGEELDKDSGLPHLAHLLTNAANLLELGYVPKEWL